MPLCILYIYHNGYLHLVFSNGQRPERSIFKVLRFLTFVRGKRVNETPNDMPLCLCTSVPERRLPEGRAYQLCPGPEDQVF
jgi:hypothetical protein